MLNANISASLIQTYIHTFVEKKTKKNTKKCRFRITFIHIRIWVYFGTSMALKNRATASTSISTANIMPPDWREKKKEFSPSKVQAYIWKLFLTVPWCKDYIVKSSTQNVEQKQELCALSWVAWFKKKEKKKKEHNSRTKSSVCGRERNTSTT